MRRLEVLEKLENALGITETWYHQGKGGEKVLAVALAKALECKTERTSLKRDKNRT